MRGRAWVRGEHDLRTGRPRAHLQAQLLRALPQQGRVPARHLRHGRRAARSAAEQRAGSGRGVGRAAGGIHPHAVRRRRRPVRRGAAGVRGDRSGRTGRRAALGGRRRAPAALPRRRLRASARAGDGARPGGQGDRRRAAQDPVHARAQRSFEQVSEGRPRPDCSRSVGLDRLLLPLSGGPAPASSRATGHAARPGSPRRRPICSPPGRSARGTGARHALGAVSVRRARAAPRRAQPAARVRHPQPARADLRRDRQPHAATRR
jgi:hypothetical protein